MRRKIPARLTREQVSDLQKVSALSRFEQSVGEPGQRRRYQFGAELGRGGMGRVLEVQDMDLNRQVAMKVLLARDTEKALRLVEEAQITGQLEHPSVVPVHDFGLDADGELFFTMQLIREHDTLKDVIARLQAGDAETHEQYSFERRVRIVQQVCHALQYAHERGVIHRDVKPSNILVGSHGEVWLVDWGIAKLVDDAEVPRPVTIDVDGSGEFPNLTGTGDWIGTPRYMAPEQILGTHVADVVSDLYSLCAVLYEFLTLHHYLGSKGERIVDLLQAVPTLVPRDAESYLDPKNGRVPRPLSRFCRRGLAKERARRYQSAAELERSLQQWIEGTAPIVCPGTAIQRALAGWSRAIDRRPVLMPAVTITLGILLLAWVVTSLALLLPAWAS